MDYFQIIPSLDRVHFNWRSKPNDIISSGQHNFNVLDYWINQRFGQKHFLLSWAEPYIVDQRFKFYEDDFIQEVYPEIDSPWKFPDQIYVGISQPDDGKDGWMLEPQYFDPNPRFPPSGSLCYMVQDPALPEFRIRLVEIDLPVKAVTWGPEKNIPKGTKLLIAPNIWLGQKGPELGEKWELQGVTESVPILNNGVVETSGQNVFEYDAFPQDPTMPHGDPEPLWNDGLDDKRLYHNKVNRSTNAHKRGTSDRLLNRWGEYLRPISIIGINNEGELEYTTNNPLDTEQAMLFGEYNFQTMSHVNWADPAHFNEVNVANFHRQMTQCLTCYNKHRCKSIHSLHKHKDRTNRVGSLGFLRNHFVDVSSDLNPPSLLGTLYAQSYCMYSIGNIFDEHSALHPTEDEKKLLLLKELMCLLDASYDNINNLQNNVEHLIRKYDSVSDLCHVNGMSRRAVEYAGHYQLLLDEVGNLIIHKYGEEIANRLQFGNLFIPITINNYTFQCLIEPAGKSHDGNNLYCLKWLEEYYPWIGLGQYGFEYGFNKDFPPEGPVIAWFSTKFDYSTYRHVIHRVWAYIWYISNHIDTTSRIKIRRLVELKPDYGKFYGNAIEASSKENFTGGTVPSKLVTFKPQFDVKRGQYVETIPYHWIWQDNIYSLRQFAEGKYIDPSGTQASGIINIKGLPGDIIPERFLAYTPPKLIKWEYSRTDRNTYNNIGKTRFWADSSGWRRGVGDIDDLFYHLSYQNPEIDPSSLVGGFDYSFDVNKNLGAMKNYSFPLPFGKGFYERCDQYEIPPPDPSSINMTQRYVAIGNTYSDIINSGIQYENDVIGTNDLILSSDFQHARNLTAPIFAYELGTDIPEHEVVQPDYYFKKMDWCTRTYEPTNVAAQREYAPVAPIWCFAQNSLNREIKYTINLGDGKVDGVEGNDPIKIIWSPRGRVWWNRKGLLCAMIEKLPDGSTFVQNGIAVINLWRKFLPHHMEVVRAYLFLEPSLEHNLGPFITIGNRNLPGFVPFENIVPLDDQSQRKMDVGESWQWANYNTRIHNANQFLGGRIVGHDVNAQMDAHEIWDKIKEHSPKILGNWEFPRNAPLKWGQRYSTVGYTDWDLYHCYLIAAEQNNYFILDNISVSINGHQINSCDPDDATHICQRSPEWYDALAKMYEDDRNTFSTASNKSFYNNANIIQGMNISKDAGEGENGKPDKRGKGYGFSKRGGGWKSQYIFDITPYVQKAYNTRFDAEFITLPYGKRKKTWEE